MVRNQGEITQGLEVNDQQALTGQTSHMLTRIVFECSVFISLWLILAVKSFASMLLFNSSTIFFEATRSASVVRYFFSAARRSSCCDFFSFNNKRERNVLFNDALNTFYLQLYGVRHMVKDHSDSEKGNPLPPHRLLLSINSKGSFICTIPQTG